MCDMLNKPYMYVPCIEEAACDLLMIGKLDRGRE